VLDAVLVDELCHGGDIVGIPEVTVEIQYDFLVGHGIDPPIMCWNDYTPKGGKTATGISVRRRRIRGEKGDTKRK
jgi:hypothetical protein